jgi:hypothetical protein
MPNYMFSYRNAKTYVPKAEDLALWDAFLSDVLASKVVDPGWPSFEPSAVLGEAGASTQFGGYSVVTAESFKEAVSLAEHCPTLSGGGGVEVAVLADLPPEHAAERIRAHLSNA